MTWDVIQGNCLDVLRGLPDASVDAVVTDPPYPEINRPYGRLTEAQWWDLMRPLVGEIRRVLKPSGSAVFVLQPNSERVGRMRPWLFDFQAWIARDWNMVQDAYWWNFTSPPTVHTHRTVGLMRPSVKACVWAGAIDCYRNQQDVLWSESVHNAARRMQGNRLEKFPSGLTMRPERCGNAALERGGVTPFNLLPVSNANSVNSGGAQGHGAATPLSVCDWWARYLTPPGGTILDPFTGSGTTGVAAVKGGFSFVGVERKPAYVEIARRRIAEAEQAGRQLEMVAS